MAKKNSSNNKVPKHPRGPHSDSARRWVMERIGKPSAKVNVNDLAKELSKAKPGHDAEWYPTYVMQIGSWLRSQNLPCAAMTRTIVSHYDANVGKASRAGKPAAKGKAGKARDPLA